MKKTLLLCGLPRQRPPEDDFKSRLRLGVVGLGQLPLQPLRLEREELVLERGQQGP